MNDRTCSVDDCDTPAKARGWCMRHYQIQYRGALTLTEAVALSTCPHCAVVFPVGRNKVYCSGTCREQAKYQNQQRVPCSTCGQPTGWKLGRVPTATCNPCRSATMTHGTAKGYKSGCKCERCTEWNRLTHLDYTRKRRAGHYDHTPCSKDGCDRGSWARTLCKMHYSRLLRELGMDTAPSKAWSDSRRSNKHTRRARIRGAGVSDKVLIADLLARDGNTCPRCQRPIDMTLAYPHKYSRSIDHTHPISKGGTHTLDNTTLMHLVCNLRKGARIEEIQHGTQQRATQHYQAEQVQVSSSSR